MFRDSTIKTMGVVALVAALAGCSATESTGSPATTTGSATSAPVTTTSTTPRATTKAPIKKAPATKKPTARPTTRPTTFRPTATKTASKLDPRYATCRAAKAAGYGPYTRGVDPEYNWYRDADHDGVVCE